MDIACLPFADLLQAALDGSSDAAQLLHQQYERHLLRVIRRKLTEPLRQLCESSDFLQDVWASFYASPPAPGKFSQPAELVAFLAGIASHKLADEARRRLRAQRCNVNRQVRLDSQLLECVAGPAARAPTPSQWFAEAEQWDRIIKGQTPRNRQILELLRQDYTHEQIARRVCVNEKTIRRLLEKLAPLFRDDR
jgi:RNA polymerase sigma factor (sigma-70 family)